MSVDLSKISLDGVGLEPASGIPAPVDNPTEGKAKFLVESREKVDRRNNVDRRGEIRFEPNRRKVSDRRPTKATWDEKKNG